MCSRVQRPVGECDEIAEVSETRTGRSHQNATAESCPRGRGAPQKHREALWGSLNWSTALRSPPVTAPAKYFAKSTNTQEFHPR